MTGKERVKAALALQTPDVLPFGEFAVDYDTVQRVLGHETYLRAKAKCKIALWEGRRDEVAQSFLEDLVALHQKLDCLDIVNLSAQYNGLLPPRDYEYETPKKIAEGRWETKDGKIYEYSPITADITLVYDPHAWDREYLVSDFEPVPTSVQVDESQFEVVDEVIQKLGDTRFIISPSGEEAGFVLPGEMERGLMEYALHPELIQAMVRHETAVGNLEDAYYIRKGADGVLWGMDFAGSRGPLISPQMFQELVAPSYRERVRHIRENFHLPVIKHACGDNSPLLDQFIDIGFTCYQSVQRTPGMDIERAYRQYGDRLCLWGGVDVAHLMDGTPEQVREDVRNAVRLAAERGNRGFILGSSHSIAVGTQYDNFMALLDEVEKLRARA